MTLDLDTDGDFLVDSNDLAEYLDVSSTFLRKQRKLCLVTSIIEAGSGEDAGRSCITVRLGKVGWQAVSAAAVI